MFQDFILSGCMVGIFVGVLFIMIFLIKIYSELTMLNFNFNLFATTYRLINHNFQEKED